MNLTLRRIKRGSRFLSSAPRYLRKRFFEGFHASPLCFSNMNIIKIKSTGHWWNVTDR
jgi:hypothetical protein